MWKCKGTEIYRSSFLLCLTIFLSLFCLPALVSNAQTAQPTPKPSPTPSARRSLPKLSNGARGFNTQKEKTTSPRLIAVGGSWGGGDEEQTFRLRRKTAQGYYKQGSKYLEISEYSKAITALEKAVKLNPNYFAAFFALGEAYALSGSFDYSDFDNVDKADKYEQMRYRQAIRALEEARRLAPKNAGTHLNLGVLYFNTGQYQKAIDSFQKGLLFKPKFVNDTLSIISIAWDEDVTISRVYCFIGEAYQYLGQNNNALKFYQQALVVNSNEEYPLFTRPIIYRDLGYLYETLGEIDKALDAYQNFVSEYKDDGDVFSSIGAIYATKKKYDEATTAFGNAISVYERDLKIYKERADKWEGIDKKIAEKDVARTQDVLAQTYYNLGVAQLSLNQTEKALESFKRVIELDEKNANARFNMAVAYLVLGNKVAAKEQAQFLKAIDSELAKELEELINR